MTDHEGIEDLFVFKKFKFSTEFAHTVEKTPQGGKSGLFSAALIRRNLLCKHDILRTKQADKPEGGIRYEFHGQAEGASGTIGANSAEPGAAAPDLWGERAERTGAKHTGKRPAAANRGAQNPGRLRIDCRGTPLARLHPCRAENRFLYCERLFRQSKRGIGNDGKPAAPESSGV